MSKADIKKWDGKYSHSETLVSIEPDQELITYQSVLPKSGKALDLACGLGKNTLFLAQGNLDVTALDGSTTGLERLRKTAQEHGLDQRIMIRQADLDHYILPDACFDLILVVRYLNRTLLPNITSALKPGGVLVYKTFNRNILKRRPGFNLAYTIETMQLIEAFSLLELVVDNRGDKHSEYAFMIGRKVG